MTDEVTVDGYVALWLFFLYAALGVVLESAYCSLWVYRSFTSRMALLYLPINPVYGCAGVAIGLTLDGLRPWPPLVFLLGAALCTALEFAVSVGLERAFGTILWDYSDQRFNLRGRISLQAAAVWGVMTLLVIFVLEPAALAVIATIPRPVGDVTLLVLTVLTVAAALLTIAAFRRTERRVAAADLSGMPPSPSRDGLTSRLVPDSVLLWTFPRSSLVLQYANLGPRLDGTFDPALPAPESAGSEHAQSRARRRRTR